MRKAYAVGSLMAALAAAPALEAQAPACADSTARALGALVGSYRARVVFRDGEAWDTVAAEATVRPDLEGCLLREELTGTRFGRPFRVLGVWGAVGLAARIQRVFVHTQHGLLSVFAGDLEAGTLVLRDSAAVRGTTVRLEHRFEPFPGDSMRFTSRRSTDGGATWTVTWLADYLRRP